MFKPSDSYTTHKAACKAMVKALEWTHSGGGGWHNFLSGGKTLWHGQGWTRAYRWLAARYSERANATAPIVKAAH